MRNTNLVIFQLSVKLTSLRKSYQRFFCCSPLFPMHNTIILLPTHSYYLPHSTSRAETDFKILIIRFENQGIRATYSSPSHDFRLEGASLH